MSGYNNCRRRNRRKFLDLLNLPLLVSLSYDSESNRLLNVSAFLGRSACKLTALLCDMSGNL